MRESGLMSHVAMSVDRSTLTETYIADLAFYGELFGWKIDDNLSIENERLLISLPGHGQYINIRALDQPMATTSYEHLGIYVESPEIVREVFGKIEEHKSSDDRIELDERGVQVLYGGVLTTFRFKYLLPLSIEVQHIGGST